MAVYTDTVAQEAFKTVLREMYKRNEAPTQEKWYSFSLSTGKSTYSFGQAQWDVGGNPAARDFLSALVDPYGNRVFSDTDIQKLALQIDMVSGDKARLDAALSQYSAYIDNFFEAKLNNDLTLIESLVAELRAVGNAQQTQVADFIAASPFAQMLLVDYNNQYDKGIEGVDGFSPTPTDGPMMQYLKGLPVTPWNESVQIDGSFDIGDITRFTFNTKQYLDSTEGALDVTRRFLNVLNIAKVNGWCTPAQEASLVDGWSEIFIRFGGKILDFVSSLFTSAQTNIPRPDPLTLDLDGDGLETIALNTTNPILFDHDGDGIKTATGWVSAHDGFLVLDRNGNGTIDSGRELFGDATLIPNGTGGTRNALDGFEALAAQDTNLDGKVSGLDANFANLRIWQDLNQNGISETNELSTLTSKNIASITVAKTENNTLLPNGNVIADLGTYTKLDGSTGTTGITGNLGDVDLRENTFYSSFTDAIPLTPAAQALPNMQGSGQVRDLREAVSLSPTLTTLLTNFSQVTTRADQRNALDALLKNWSDTSPMLTTATGAYAGHLLTVTFDNVTSGTPEYTAWLDKLTILERFNGRTFRVVPTGTDPVTVAFNWDQMDMLNQSYNALKESAYNALFLQTRGKAYLDAIGLGTDAEGNNLVDHDPDGQFLNTTIEHHDKCHRSPGSIPYLRHSPENITPLVLLAA